MSKKERFSTCYIIIRKLNYKPAQLYLPSQNLSVFHLLFTLDGFYMLLMKASMFMFVRFPACCHKVS